MKKFVVVLIILFTSLLISETGYSMQWDIITHPENQSIFSWEDNHKWVIEEKISRMFIINGNKVDQLHYFNEKDDEGEAAISRRWHLTITDLPESAWWPNRSIQVTVYGQEYGLDSVLDGSTFGEISVWEHNPDNIDEINLVIDFTKVRSQNHEFGVHILILHDVLSSPSDLEERVEALEQQMENLTQKIIDLEENLENHRHIYRTGKGEGHNKVRAKTGLAKFPATQ